MKIIFSLGGMECVSCAKGIEKKLRSLPGIQSAHVYFASNSAEVTYDPAILPEEQIYAEVESLGYSAQKDVEERPKFQRFYVSGLLTLPLFLHMLGRWFGSTWPTPFWIQAIMSGIVVWGCGYTLIRSALSGLKVGLFNMDLLIVIGATSAWLLSISGLSYTYFDGSAMIITLVFFGRWLEGRAKQKCTASLEKLIQEQPHTVYLKRNGEYLETSIAHIKAGDYFIVRPGEKVAVDGKVVEGTTEVNEALLTGESVFRLKQVGDPIFSGTINQTGTVTVLAKKIGSETLLGRILQSVKEAQNIRPPIENLVDRITQYFVPGVLTASLLTCVGWLITGSSFSVAVMNAISVLVIACPCALGLATPTVIAVAVGMAADRGILLRGGEALENLTKLTTIFVDKTGTLTRGKPALESISAFNVSQVEVLLIASSLANRSEHPLAEAIVSAAKSRNITPEPINHFSEVIGCGMQGVKRGKICAVGSYAFLKELTKEITPFEGSGVVYDGEFIGVIGFSDLIREFAKKAVKTLQGRNIEIILLTGDHPQAAKEVAEKVNIQTWHAEMLPDDKMRFVKEWHGVKGMVGDGINDAAALAVADVSFAIDQGSDIAIETSDITLVRGDLMGVVRSIDLAHATYKKLWQNLALAFLYNIIAIPFAIQGILTPVIAAAAMAMSSLSVVTNALLLRRH